MSTMLDIAGRLVVGGTTMAVLLMGIRMVAYRDAVGFDQGIRLIGSLLIAADTGFVFWLVVGNGFSYF
jgi:hypothetical protein